MVSIAYPDFGRIESVLLATGELGDAAEVHGSLCAMFTVGAIGEDTWVRQVLRSRRMPPDVGREAEKLLRQLYACTVQNLADPEMGFHPFLPDDDEDLAHRTRALAAWCSGFLFGLAVSGVTEKQLGESEVAEFVRDLDDITQVFNDPEETQQSEEQSFTELVEYVRMGTLLVATEFQGPAPESKLH